MRLLVDAAREADAKGRAEQAADARAALRRLLRGQRPDDSSTPPEVLARERELWRIANDERPYTLALPSGVTAQAVQRLDARGHIDLRDTWNHEGWVSPGQWVFRLGKDGREVWVPIDVAPTTTEPVAVSCPVDPATMPEGTLYVPAGRVKGPLGEAQVPALLWERTEVTIERYAAWLATLPAEEQARRVPRAAGALGEASRPLWDKKDGKFVPPKSLAALAPVDGISLYDARAFAAAQGRRLPTAPEWAWAAAGPFAAPTPVGSTDALFSLPLTLGSGAQRPGAVGGNEDDLGPFGLRDMAGNVAEWTSTLTTLDGTNGWLVMGSGYGLPPERALVTRAAPEPGWKPLQGVGFRCVLPAP